MTRAAPEAYLFDMDGLLLDSERLARDCFLQVTDAFGLDRARAGAFFLTLIGTSVQETTRMTRAFLPDHVPVEAVETRWAALYEAAVERGVPLRPTVAATLDRLSRQNARMAVVTSTHGPRARRKLEVAGIAGHFEFVLGGDEVSRNKPHPAPYLEAAARIGLPPSRCAAFEDSDRGIAAAVAAGCRSVQIPDLRPAEAALPALGQEVAPDLARAVARLAAPIRERIGGDL